MLLLIVAIVDFEPFGSAWMQWMREQTMIRDSIESLKEICEVWSGLISASTEIRESLSHAAYSKDEKLTLCVPARPSLIRTGT